MDSESFVSRVMTLIQKSRRALRLYSTAGGSSYGRVDGAIGELPAVQVAEWREVNGLLLRKLTEAAEAANTKKIIYDVFALGMNSRRYGEPPNPSSFNLKRS